MPFRIQQKANRTEMSGPMQAKLPISQHNVGKYAVSSLTQEKAKGQTACLKGGTALTGHKLLTERSAPPRLD